NLQVAVHEENNSINFLHRIVEGSSERSYGINVAEIAGIPMEVLLRAKVLLGEFENPKSDKSFFQPLLFEDNSSELLRKIKMIDLQNITPIEAINILNGLQKEID
ncbi:MAG: DNA mismatch repair protein MutS, partial [Candidatus Marinimicrobia bacterium]|nr:DNA mismatch repair protein MutS [Candidatus Neomarinimicrobiota bacterium]